MCINTPNVTNLPFNTTAWNAKLPDSDLGRRLIAPRIFVILPHISTKTFALAQLKSYGPLFDKDISFASTARPYVRVRTPHIWWAGSLLCEDEPFCLATDKFQRGRTHWVHERLSGICFHDKSTIRVELTGSANCGVQQNTEWWWKTHRNIRFLCRTQSF